MLDIILCQMTSKDIVCGCVRCIDVGTTLAGIIGDSLQHCHTEEREQARRRRVHLRGRWMDGWMDRQNEGLRREVMAKQGDTR